MPEPNWEVAEKKLLTMKAKVVTGLTLVREIRRGKTRSGQPLHPDTLATMKTTKAVAARSAMNAAWAELDASMTP